MKNKPTVIVVLLLLALPSVASANTGTPLMWAGMMHLVIGNFFIGLLEGFILSRYFGLPNRKTALLMILANYFSAWVGGLFLRGVIVHVFPLDLNNAWHFFWSMVVVTYVMTLVLEFPFVGLTFRGKPQWFRKTVCGSLLIQTVSYVLLFGWYWSASGTSLYTKTEVVPLSAIALPEDVLLYFIAPEDGAVYQQKLVNTDRQKVFDLHSKDRNDRLFVWHSATDSSHWDLIARLVTDNRRNSKLVTVKAAFAAEAAPGVNRSPNDPPEKEYDTWFNFGIVPKLGDAKNSPWEVRTGFWSGEGLHATQTKTGTTVAFSYETPFGEWIIRNATLLPTDKVLFQLGDNQICIFDLQSKHIVLVTKGRGPVAVMGEKP